MTFSRGWVLLFAVGSNCSRREPHRIGIIVRMRVAKLFLTLLVGIGVAAKADDKPVIAVFPLGGDAPKDFREKIGFSIRTKLDRDGHYEPIDGPTIAELAGDTGISVGTSPAVLAVLVKEPTPAAFVWGEVDGVEGKATLKIKTLDLQKKDAKPVEIDRPIAAPTDVRFAVEDALASLAGVGKFSHLSEAAASSDPGVGLTFDSRPNLIPGGDFATGDAWSAILRSDRYKPPVQPKPPEVDRVAINGPPDPKGMNALGMNLSKDVAESNGLACLSSPIPIAPQSHYRLKFEYKSDGPNLHVFVKGYVPTKNMAGQPDEKQTYERQVPPSGATANEWVTVTCDLDPSSAVEKPTTLRVDLYAYLKPGLVWFRNVQLKRVDLE